MKNKLKFFLRGFLFAAFFCVLLYPASRILSFKYQDGIQTIRNYYDLPKDTVDVLLVGSSHIGVDVDPSILWDDYGIASYNCWGAMQPDWNTYYYLKECLKTQTPKLVVMDAFMTTTDEEYAEYSYAVKNTMGLRLSQDKIAAVQASAQKSSWSTLLLGLPAYHSRYSEISAEDFSSFFWNKHTDIQKIASSGDLVYPTSILVTSKITGRENLTAKSEDYLRRILSLCKEKKVPIQLVSAPYTLTEQEQRRFNRVREIATEYGVKFFNYNDNYKEIGINPKTDFRDEGHLNDKGIRLYTDALGKQWKSTYSLPDRRKDPNHIWNKRPDADLKPVYTLKEQFVGDGKQNYVDTGIKLCANPLASWTVLTEIEVPRAGNFDKVLFSCFDETDRNNHGILLRGKDNGALSVICTSLEAGEIRGVSGTVKIALVKSGTTLTVYCNGKQTQTIQMDDVKSYNGDLLIGCEELPTGEKFRFSPVTVHAMTVYDQALSEASVSSWSPTWPPMPKSSAFVPASDAKLKLANRFTGDGMENYVDTGCRLYEDPNASWTLLSQISPNIEDGDTVYFSCFNEKDGDYKGLLVRRVDKGKLNILYGGGVGVTVDIPTDQDTTLAVRKNRSLYSIYVNGKKIVDEKISASTSYGGTLLVGCEKDEKGNLFRYSGTTVYNLWLVNGLMNDKDILGWTPAHAPEAAQPAGLPVNYTLEHGFAGDGKGSHIDTGARLYDTPEKNWTVQVQIDRDDACRGAVLSCFAEDPNRYRGLLIRQTDTCVFGITTGQNYTEVTVPSEKTVTLTIVKAKYDYTIYVDGKQAASTQSRCASYSGPLMLGCERELNGNPFRFSDVRIRSLNVHDGALSAAQVAGANQ